MSAEAWSNRLAVIILNWNGLVDTQECLDSLAHHGNPVMEVIVVDNGSSGPQADAISTQYPWVTVIRNPENFGYAGGNNVGLRYALERGAERFLLLNNDTVVVGDCICSMMQAFTRAGSCLLHPSIYYFDEPEVPQLDPLHKKPSEDRNKIHGLSHAYGAALMVNREVLEKVGLFDERFFVQLEETDLHMRARRQGFDAKIIPAARVLHKESRSFGGIRTPLKTYYATRNSLLLNSKHGNGVEGWLHTIKRLIWTCNGLRQSENPSANDSAGMTAVWCAFSGSSFAIAFRRGVWHFLTRRFGRAPEELVLQLRELRQ